MVNNNQIPIEVNKKPFETVYELKNEVPSFEEFMKTYKMDENLNYEDLNSGSVGEVKGYGPCIPYDPNCSCTAEQLREQLRNQHGTRWTNLVMPCPVVGCSNRTSINWTHPECGGSLELSDKAYIWCRSCGTVNKHLRYWDLKCSSHAGSYFSINFDSFTRSLNFAYADNSMDRDLLKGLLWRIGDPESEW